MLAAAPGEVLPTYPEPVHCFQVTPPHAPPVPHPPCPTACPQGPHFQEVEVDGRKYSTTCRRPGAPRRALTAWDAISDLPEIPAGHDQLTIPYRWNIHLHLHLLHSQRAQSHLQRTFRAESSAVVDHITKPLNPLQQVHLVPLPPTTSR